MHFLSIESEYKFSVSTASSTARKKGQTASGELAESLGLTRGTVSKIVDKLDAKGWIQTEAKEGDSRFRLLSLTRAGRLAKLKDRHSFQDVPTEEGEIA